LAFNVSRSLIRKLNTKWKCLLFGEEEQLAPPLILRPLSKFISPTRNAKRKTPNAALR